MMRLVIRVLSFVGLAALGYAGIFGVYVLWLSVFNTLPDDAHLQAFKTAYFGGGMLAFIAGTLIGLSSFFMAGRARIVFMLLPFLVPVLYSFGVMLYFH